MYQICYICRHDGSSSLEVDKGLQCNSVQDVLLHLISSGSLRGLGAKISILLLLIALQHKQVCLLFMRRGGACHSIAMANNKIPSCRSRKTEEAREHDYKACRQTHCTAGQVRSASSKHGDYSEFRRWSKSSWAHPFDYVPGISSKKQACKNAKD